MRVLVSKLEEQSKQNAYLSAKIDDLSQKDFCFDNSTTRSIGELKNALNEVRIPKEVRVTKGVEFSDITSKVILWFFLISLPIVGISLYVGINGVTIDRTVKSYSNTVKIDGDVYSQPQVKWLLRYYSDMKKKNPKTHNAFWDKNTYPKYEEQK